jgi:CubicO group peptidase (beta-lactamase class C family)
MRILKRIVLILGVIVGIAVLAAIVSGKSYLLSGVRKTYLVGEKTPDIDDMKYFDVRKIAHGTPVQPLFYSDYRGVLYPPTYDVFANEMDNSAFLVFWRDSLVFEHYWEGDTSTLTNSFSMAKSFTSMMIGAAIDDGLIRNVDQPVGDFLPEYAEGLNGNLTIRHLLQMTSGIPFGESYSSPFGYMAEAYFGHDLQPLTTAFKVEKEPGTQWAYEGGNTVLLGLIIQKATGKSPSAYFEEKFWSRLGTSHDAYWNLDHEDGLEKTFSGFYATARDFSRIGTLFMHNGVYQGDTLLSPDFIKQSITPHLVPDDKGESCSWYGWQWWMGEHHGYDMYMCRGLRGQYIICIPEAEVMVVRIGHKQSKDRLNHLPEDIYTHVDIALDILKQQTGISFYEEGY